MATAESASSRQKIALFTPTPPQPGI
jgi:hypothetical protein